MPTFRVLVRGEGLRVSFDAEEAVCGFYKSQFLRAASDQEASEKAISAVLQMLGDKKNVNKADLARLRPVVEEVEEVGMLGALRREGFTFYKLDSNESSREPLD